MLKIIHLSMKNKLLAAEIPFWSQSNNGFSFAYTSKVILVYLLILVKLACLNQLLKRWHSSDQWLAVALKFTDTF